VLATLGVPGLAAALVDSWAEDRGRLQAERQTLTQRFADEERACASRFVVTSCQDQVRARRREALAPLRERELQLDEAERRERAAQRRQAIATKQAAAAAAAGAASAVPAPQLRVRQPLAPAPAASRPVMPREDDRAAEAAARAQASQGRRDAAQAAQARVARREAERQAGQHHSQTLPVPTAASGAGR
jgi:Tfp pilus assembly protein FimV